MKEIVFEMEDVTGRCKTQCPFGMGVGVNSNACERCEKFIRCDWRKRSSYNVPIGGTVYCRGDSMTTRSLAHNALAGLLVLLILAAMVAVAVVVA